MAQKMKKLLLLLLLVSTSVTAQECFYPAHNFAGWSSDMLNSTGWSRTATVTNATASVAPPEAMNVTTTWQAVGLAATNEFFRGNTFNRYVVDGAGYIISAYVRFSSGTQWLRFGVAGAAYFACNYDIQNGVTGSCVGLTNPTITNVGNSWYYITANYSGSVAGMSGTFRLTMCNGNSSSSGCVNMAGGETIHFAALQAMDDRVPVPERRKYIETTSGVAAWGQPVQCTTDLFNNLSYITGTAIAGTTGWVQMPTSFYPIGDGLKSRMACITSGTGAGQCRCVRSYDAAAAEQKAYVTPNFNVAPASGSGVIFREGCEARIVGVENDVITANAIAADAIGASEIAANAIGSSEIAADAIGSSQLATSASNEIRDGILSRPLEDNYSINTFGWIVDRIRKYTSNRMTKSGSTYTIYKNDETTTYETGTTNGVTRDPN